jgi:hypothetical protein
MQIARKRLKNSSEAYCMLPPIGSLIALQVGKALTLLKRQEGANDLKDLIQHHCYFSGPQSALCQFDHPTSSSRTRSCGLLLSRVKPVKVLLAEPTKCWHSLSPAPTTRALRNCMTLLKGHDSALDLKHNVKYLDSKIAITRTFAAYLGRGCPRTHSAHQ